MQVEENVEYILSKDADGHTLSGDKNYLFHLPPNIPAKDYWSVIVYDSLTNSIIKNSQSWPSVYSTSKRLVVKKDGSIDIRIGPETPSGEKKNWIQTVPGKSWTIILRLYGTMDSWFDKSWKPGEITAISDSQKKLKTSI